MAKPIRKRLLASTLLMGVTTLAATAFVAAPAYAQDYTNVATTGHVQGTNGKPIAGATVTVTSNEQGFSQTTTTDSGGNFRIAQIPQGSYTIKVTASGYDNLVDSNVYLGAGSSANQFTLAAVGASGSDIVVTAGRVKVVDFDRNTTGAVINVADIAARVPVARDITSVTLLSPGTAAGDNRFGNLPSINGASVSENVYYVNGLNITQFRNGLGAVAIPFDFYKSVEVKNGGIPAEYGRMTGGVINAVTQSGTNKFHGGVTFNWEPNELRAKPRNTFASDNDSSQASRTDVIATLSGPIIKDHLFFFALYNARNVQSAGGSSAASATLNPSTGAVNPAAPCVVNPAICDTVGDLASFSVKRIGTTYIADSTQSPFYAAKIDAVFGGQHLEATYWNTSGVTIRSNYNTYNVVTNQFSNFGSNTLFRFGGENYVLRYTGKFTNWLTLSAAYGVNKNIDTTESSTPNYPSIVDSRGLGLTGNTAANGSVNSDKRTFYRADADLTFRLMGSHHVRFGYDREDLDESSVTKANGGFQYTYALASGPSTTIDPTVGLPGGTQYAVARTFVTGGQFKTRNTAYYVQDSWSLFDNRLQLNLGLRNDQFVSRNGNGVVFYKSGNQWAPRLGFSLDPFGDRRTKVYGSFSRYFLPVAVNTNVRLAGSELDYDAYYRLLGTNADNTPILGAPITTGAGFETCPSGGPAGTSCVVRNDGTVADTASVVASNLKPQSTDEYIIGLEQRLGSRVRVGAFFTYTKLNNSLEDAALDQAIVPYCTGKTAAATATACRAIWNGVHQYALINPGRDVSVTLSDPLPGETTLRTVTLSAASLGYPAAKRTYKGVSFTFDRDWDGKWSLSANYTYSFLEGNIEGGVRSDNGQTDSGLTTAFDLPALVNGTYGYLPNDRRHNLKVYGTYKLAEWFTLGANITLQSPRQFGCYGRAPASADYDASAPGGLAGRFYGAGAAYCNVVNGQIVRNPVGFTTVNPAYGTAGTTTLQIVPRASAIKSDWLSQINLDGEFKIPTDAFDGFVRVSVFNVLNSHAVLRVSEVGTTSGGSPSVTYSMPLQYQSPRAVRLQLGVKF